MACGDVRAQHVLDAFMAEVDMADDAGAGAHLAIDAARRHRGDAVDELGLADRPQRVGPVGAVHRAAFHVDGADHLVAAVEIGQQLVEQIARDVADDVHEAVLGRRQVLQDRRRPVPQMMMRVDDRQVGLEDGLGHVISPRRSGGSHSPFPSRAEDGRCGAARCRPRCRGAGGRCAPRRRRPG